MITLASYTKIILVGDVGVGKTTYVTKLRTSNYNSDYHITMGVKADIMTIEGHKWNMWDCTGNPKLRGLRGNRYYQTKGALVFCDITSMSSILGIHSWVQEVRSMMENARIVIVITHFDKYANDTLKQNIRCIDSLSKSLNIQSVIISSLHNINMTKPLALLSELISKH